MLSVDEPLEQMSCNICKKAFRFTKALKKHVNNVHPDDYDRLFPAQPKNPPVVKYWSDNEISKLTHYEGYHRLKFGKKASGAVLAVYLERSRSSVNHIRRKSSYKTKLKTLLSNKKLDEIKDILDFKKIDGGKVCSECGKLFKNESGVIRHKAVDHNSLIDAETPTTDKYNEEEMRVMARWDAKHRELKNHRFPTFKLQKILGSSSRRPRAINLIRNRPDYMKILQEEIDKLKVPEYRSNAALDLAETEFHRNKPTKCSDCSLVFRNRSDFERHVRLTHLNQMVLSVVDDGSGEAGTSVNHKIRQLKQEKAENDSEPKRRRYSAKEAEEMREIKKENMEMKKMLTDLRREMDNLNEREAELTRKNGRFKKEMREIKKENVEITKTLNDLRDEMDNLNKTVADLWRENSNLKRKKKKIAAKNREIKAGMNDKMDEFNHKTEAINSEMKGHSNIDERNKENPEKERVSEKRKHKSKRKESNCIESLSNIDDRDKDLPDTEQIVSKKRKHQSKGDGKVTEESALSKTRY